MAEEKNNNKISYGQWSMDYLLTINNK